MAVQLSKDSLREQYVGKTLNDVVTPQVVLDLAKVEANCNLMLEAAERLQISWRAHIKTHKVCPHRSQVTHLEPISARDEANDIGIID